MSAVKEGPKIVAILGTVRPANYTAKALALVVNEFQKMSVACELIDPASLKLTFPGIEPSPAAEKLRKTISDATGVVLATPEYHGSFSSVMKLVIENLGFPSVLSGKPVALLGVAAGRIGAIKSLEQLRGVCSHIGALVLPLAVSVANVQQVFDPKGKCLDPAVEKTVRGVATNLLDYIRNHVCPRITLERLVREGKVS